MLAKCIDPEEAHMNDRKLILCVEDDPDNAHLIQYLLRNVPADLIMAGRGEQAAALMAGQQPDLVLLDLLLPGASGLDWLESLRIEGRLAGTPVVVVSVRTDPDQHQRAKQMGAKYYVHKPFAPETLREAIEQALGVDWKAYW